MSGQLNQPNEERVCSASCQDKVGGDTKTRPCWVISSHGKLLTLALRPVIDPCSASCRNKMGRDTKGCNETRWKEIQKGAAATWHFLTNVLERIAYGSKCVLHCDSRTSSMCSGHRGREVAGDNAHEQVPHRRTSTQRCLKNDCIESNAHSTVEW